MKTIILIRNEDEAKVVKRSHLAKKYPIVTLNPASQAELDEVGLRIINSRELYSDISHENNVVRIKDCLAEFEQLIAATKFSEAQCEVLRSALFSVLGVVAFFYELLNGIENLYWVERNKIRFAANRDEALAGMLKPLFERNYFGHQHKISHLHKFMLRNYNAKLLNKLAGLPKMVVIGGMGRKSSKNFAEEVRKLDSNIAVLNARAPLRLMLFSWRQMNKFLAGKTNFPVYFFYPAKTTSCVTQIDKIIDASKNNFLKLAVKISRNYLTAIANETAGYEITSRQDIAAIKPKLVISDPVNDSFTVSARRFAAQLGAKVMIFNHASHSVQQDATSKTISDLWASMGRIYNKYATYTAVRSPAVYELVKQISPYENIVLPVRHDKKLLPVQKEKFTIVFAGNYLKAEHHIPWIAETPDEFMLGIEELAAAVAQIPQVNLVIRVKPGKSECGIETIRKRISSSPNIELKNSGSFKDDLAVADIVVASISTTIDEALQSGRAVLLHSATKRYRHLLSMTEPPVAAKRSAVYASTKQVPLVDLLRGIIAAHKDRPLNDDELTPYIWPESEPDMHELAKRILEL